GLSQERPFFYVCMRTWLSFHCYPLEAQDIFLTRALRPFLTQYIWPRPVYFGPNLTTRFGGNLTTRFGGNLTTS
ncbi:MAG: hypothetical protein LH618_11860, partial [Saprospiraceae bacterium]|nr:hypothetical protein [Saprospiraceae bacterium]